MLEVKTIKTNEEIYKTVLEENNFLPNVFTLDGVANLLSLETRRVPIILYDIGNSIKDFEAIAYEEAKTYSREEARDFIKKSKTLENRLILFMARSVLHEKFNYPVVYYINSLEHLREYFNIKFEYDNRKERFIHGA